MKVVRVQDVVLDESHFHWDNEDSLGIILYTELNAPTPRNNNFRHLPAARPIFYNMDYPIPGELVLILTAPAPTHNEYGNEIEYYFPAIALHKSPTSNALPNAVSKTGNHYKGAYFKENESVSPLRVYEGDVIIEGRFGNSIRFGSTIRNDRTLFPNYWSNKGKQGNPITILRNGQNPGLSTSENEPGIPYVHLLEDIQNDDATIALCSMQEISNFTPASLHNLSYQYEQTENTKNKEEVEPQNTNMDNTVEEDIPSAPAHTLATPPSRTIMDANIPNIQDNLADFDISPTEKRVIFPEDEVALISGSLQNDSDLNQTLGV